ncbi:MAG: hypothetical protein M3134_02885 [Actinomycetota bacterium]|nr:hypothetical protein [Actinomycetota bacterium]
MPPATYELVKKPVRGPASERIASWGPARDAEATRGSQSGEARAAIKGFLSRTIAKG